jgi:hypothetical protein
MNGTKRRVGIHNCFEQALKSATKLHGFKRGYWQGGLIDTRKRVVNDCTMATIALRDHPRRGDF